MATPSASANCAGCSSSRSSTIRIRNSNSLNADYRSPIPKKYQWRTWAADPEGITGEALLDFINGELFPALKDLPTSSKAGDRRRVVRDVFEDAYNYMKSGQLMRQVVNKINDVDFNNLAERQHFGDIYEQILNDLQSAGNAGEYYTPRAVTAFMVDRIDPHPGEILLDPACGTGGFLTCAHPPHAQALREAARRRRDDAGAPCARSRRSSFPTCSASPTCCCTASRTRASCATTTRWRGPTSATRSPTASTSC